MRPVQSVRRVMLLVGIALLIVLLSAPAALAAKPNSNGHGHNGGGTPPPASGPFVVCLDPGHGGTDSGATATYTDSSGTKYDLQEKVLTLQIANMLKTKLTNDLNPTSGKHYYEVIMTRTTDVSLTNTQRAEICNGSDLNNTNPSGLVAEAVIAIHLNASTDLNADYFQDFWGKKNKDLAFSQAITDNYHIPALTSSNGCTSTDYSGCLTDNPVGQFASSVLLKTNCPATLAETVFLSNTDEQAALVAGTRQPQIVNALYAGITNWFKTP